jgi:hypothetical protein
VKRFFARHKGVWRAFYNWRSNSDKPVFVEKKVNSKAREVFCKVLKKTNKKKYLFFKWKVFAQRCKKLKKILIKRKIKLYSRAFD